MIMGRLFFCIACFFIFFSCRVLAERFISYPQGFISEGGVENASLAFDESLLTYAFIPVNGSNMSFFGFNRSDHADGERIFQVDLVLSLAVENIADDLWGVWYSEDNGSAALEVRPYASETLSLQDIRLANVTNYPEENWTWTGIADALQLVLRTKNDSVVDGGAMLLYRVHAEVVVDADPPNITFISPANNTDYQLSEDVLFRFMVDDNSSVVSCSLVLNGSVVETLFSPGRNAVNIFNVTLENKDYDWRLNCTDDIGLEGTTGLQSLTVDANRRPSVTAVDAPYLINLSVGASVPVVCNASSYDLDGGDDLSGFIGKIYLVSKNFSDVDSASDHYTNFSCDVVSASGNVKNITCGFEILYNALPGEWYCNVSAYDVNGTSGANVSLVNVSELWGMNLSVTSLDYGTLNPGENSTADESFVVENIGNMEIDVSVYGYGIYEDDGLSMTCDEGNISVQYERYSLTGGLVYGAMTSLSADPMQLDLFNLPPKNDTFEPEKALYWKMGVPKPSKTNCSGFIVVGLTQS
jgi:hypothetical protein